MYSIDINETVQLHTNLYQQCDSCMLDNYQSLTFDQWLSGPMPS